MDGKNWQVKLIKEEFGYDDGFNYHEETDYDAALSKLNTSSLIHPFLSSQILHI